GLEPVLLGVLERLILEIEDHLVDVVLERGHLARGFHRDLAGQVALRHRGGDFGDRAHLVGQVGGHRIHVVGQVAPQAGRAGYTRLAAAPALDAVVAGLVGVLVAEGRQRLDHAVDRLGQRGDLAFRVEGQLALEIALGDRGDDVGDAAHLVGQVVGHLVDVVGQVLPGAADARNLRLPAELALGADLARHAGYFAGERVQLVYHRVDGVLELEDLALHVDGDLAREIAAGDRRGDVGDGADLAGQVGGHPLDVVGQVLPGARVAAHLRLGAEVLLVAALSNHAGGVGGD